MSRALHQAAVLSAFEYSALEIRLLRAPGSLLLLDSVSVIRPVVLYVVYALTLPFTLTLRYLFTASKLGLAVSGRVILKLRLLRV